MITEEFASTISKSMSDAFTTTPIYVLKSHPFFPALLKAFQTEGKLQEFWTLHIEPQIGKGNTYQSKMGFAILDLILSMVDDKKSTMIYFTVNVRETALAFLSKLEASSQDESLILSCLAKITAAAKDCPEIQKDVLNALLTFPGNIAFDKATGGNVVRQLIAFSSKESIQHVGVLYRRAIMGQPDSGQERNSMERVYAAHQLAKLVSHSAMQDDLEWKVETLNFLLMCTLFDVKSEIPPLTSVPLPFSREAKLEIKDVFFKALDFKAKNIEGMSTVLRKVANFADGLFSQASMIKPFGLDAKKSWRQAMKDIDAISDGNKKENQVFQLLYLHMAFQLMSEPDMAKETLADLRECYQRSCRKGDKTKKKKKKSSAAASREEEEEPQWVEVVIDLLLSLLSQNKHVLRQLVNSIFSLLCPHMSIDALKVITDVINPTTQESANETVNGDNDSDDEYETEDEEEIVGEDDKEKEADDDSEEEEDDDSEDDEDMGNGNVPDELVAKLKAAMGEEGNNQSDAESVNMDDIPEDDMNKMDEALANVFKQLSGKKGGAEKRKEQKDVLALMHFKTRALDMVDVYLGQNPYLSHVLFIIDFVLAALETVSKKKELKPLECRLRNTLKKVTNLKKPAQIKLDDQFDSSAMVDVLQGFVELANGGSPLMSLLSNPIPLFAQCCTLIVKFSQQMGGQDLSSKIQGVYERAIEDFFSKK